MNDTYKCSLCGQTKDVVVVVAVVCCPRCDRIPCGHCGASDLTGRRQRCGACHERVGLHAGGG